MKGFLAVALVFALLGAAPVQACKVPVFRYALERWEADAFRVVAIYRGDERKAEVERLLSPLASGPGNVRVEMVEAGAMTDAQAWQFGDLSGVGDEPWLRLHWPPEAGVEEPLWEGALSEANVALVRDSPARRALVDLILGGASTVWMLVGEGDEREVAALRAGLGEATAGMKLPEGVLRASDLLSGAVDASGAAVEMDDVLRTDIPFRLDFPVLAVRRDDPAEAVFLAMLARGLPDGLGESFVVPVFGRGRMIDALPASRLDPSRLARACAYLCGECSCQVKDENPGADLLLAVDWSARLATDLALVERRLAALPAVVKPEQVVFGGTTTSSPVPRAGWPVGGGIALVLVAGAFFLRGIWRKA